MTLHVGDLADTPVEVVRRVVEVNLIGAILVARRAVRDMVAGGSVVNVSSAAATLGSAHEYVHYAAAKAGVDALTVGLAQDSGRCPTTPPFESDRATPLFQRVTFRR